MRYTEGQYRPNEELIQSPEVFEADTLSVVLRGNKEQVAKLSPIELILLFDGLSDWIGVADVSGIDGGESAKNELIAVLRDITIKLGEAIQEPDNKKVQTFVLKTVQQLRGFTPIFELAQTGKTEHVEIEKTEKNKDLAFNDYFDPTFYGYDTIAAHTERILLTFDQILARHEYAEQYEPVLESLSTAVSQIIHDQVTNKNSLLYKGGEITLADIQARMPEQQWQQLLAYLHTHRELHTAIKGKEFADTDVSRGRLVDSRGHVISSENRASDVPFANILHIALRETVDQLDTDSDQERNAARKLLDEWYGQYKPEAFDVEALTWDIELAEIIEAAEDEDIKRMLEEYQQELGAKRITNKNLDGVLTAVEQLLALLDTKSDAIEALERKKDAKVAGPVEEGMHRRDNKLEVAYIEKLYKKMAEKIVAVAIFNADQYDFFEENQAQDITWGTIKTKTTDLVHTIWRGINVPIQDLLGGKFREEVAAEIVLRRKEQERLLMERKKRTSNIIDTLSVLDSNTIREALHPVWHNGDFEIRSDIPKDMRIIEGVRGNVRDEDADYSIPFPKSIRVIEGTLTFSIPYEEDGFDADVWKRRYKNIRQLGGISAIGESGDTKPVYIEFSQLQYVTGNVELNLAHEDDTFIFPELTTVEGDFVTRPCVEAKKLTRIGNKFRIIKNQYMKQGGSSLLDVYPLLSEVGGDMFIKGRPPELPMLRKVVGEIDVRYVEFRAPQLQTSGDIDARSATKFEVPMLEECENIDARSATVFEVPMLKRCGYIRTDSATGFEAPMLEGCGDISARSATVFEVPMLKRCGYIRADSAIVFEPSMLEECENIDARSATKFEVPMLKRCRDISVRSATVFEVPMLERCRSIDADSVTVFEVPMLKRCGDISVRSAVTFKAPQLKYAFIPNRDEAEDCYGINAVKATTFEVPELEISSHLKLNSLKQFRAPKLIRCGGAIWAISATTLHVPNLEYVHRGTYVTRGVFSLEESDVSNTSLSHIWIRYNDPK